MKPLPLLNIATNYDQRGNERSNNLRKISRDEFEVDNVDLIMVKFDFLNQRFDKLEKDEPNVHVVGATNLLSFVKCMDILLSISKVELPHKMLQRSK